MALPLATIGVELQQRVSAISHTKMITTTGRLPCVNNRALNCNQGSLARVNFYSLASLRGLTPLGIWINPGQD